MLRALDLRLGEARAATQAKPLTSFLIQDILRDSGERRGGHRGSPQPRPPPQPPRQPAPRQHPEPEPEEGRGGAGAGEDEPSARPCAARVKAEPPAETESGKSVRLGRPGCAGWGPAEGGAAWRLYQHEGESKAHFPEFQLQGCGARRYTPRDLTASRSGRASGLTLSPSVRVAQDVDSRLTRPHFAKASGGPGAPG